LQFAIFLTIFLYSLRARGFHPVKDLAAVVMTDYKSSQVCTALNGAFDLGLDKKYYLPKELNKKLKKFQTNDSLALEYI